MNLDDILFIVLLVLMIVLFILGKSYGELLVCFIICCSSGLMVGYIGIICWVLIVFFFLILKNKCFFMLMNCLVFVNVSLFRCVFKNGSSLGRVYRVYG